MMASDNFAAELTSQIADLRLPLASRLARAGQFDAAEAVLENIETPGPTVQLLRGRIYAQSGQVANARTVFEEILQTDSSNTEAAAALSALRAMAVDGVSRKLVLWRIVTAVLVLLVVVLSLLESKPDTPAVVVKDLPTLIAVQSLGERIADLEATLQREIAAIDTPRPLATGQPVAAHTDDLLGFASVHELINTNSRYAGVSCSPHLNGDGSLLIRCSGNVSSNWIYAKLRDDVSNQARSATASFDVGIDWSYVVRHNDSLSTIAQRVYGDSSRWPAIWNTNRATVTDPNRLLPATELTLPK